MTTAIRFFVPGHPAPQGSKAAFCPPGCRGRGHQRPIMVESSKRLKPWRRSVATLAAAAMEEADASPMNGPVNVALSFMFPRPRKHFRSGKFAHLLKPQFVKTWPTARQIGDLDKLVRAVLDGITDKVIGDDSHVVGLIALKKWVGEPGVEVGVEIHAREAEWAGLTEWAGLGIRGRNPQQQEGAR